MATRTQGLLLGCFLLVAVFGILFTVSAVFLTHSWTGGNLPLVSGGRVGLVVLEGPIGPSRAAVEELDACRRDPSIKAVVLRINSPGGEVAPSQEIYNAVRRLVDTKPVVASLGGIAASGGYYVAVAADSIVADPGTLTGSIGVIFAYPTAVDLMDKVGVEMEVFKSGAMKDMGSYAREPTEAEEEVFDSLIADIYEQFVTAVAEGRGLDRDRVLALADGRVFTGRQAGELGLVDALGDLHAAANMAAGMAGLPPEPSLVSKARPRLPFLELLERLLADGVRASWGPRLEYRFR